MSVLDEALEGEDLVVGFPVSGVEDWMVAAEVMLLEGIRAWTFPVSLLDLVPEALAMYGYRARIGVSGLVTPEAVRQAVTAGAHFLTSPVQGVELASAAGSVPFVPGALTPGEVNSAVSAGFGAVQVVPAHVLGSGYARSLPGLVPPVDLMVTGRIERYQADLWWRAGIRVVCTEGVILVDEADAGRAVNTPAEVRRRSQNYRTRLETTD